MEDGWVKNEINGNICRVTFYHPSSNSLPGVLLRKLEAAITAAGSDNNIRVIILQSEGNKAFCAGASFDELMTIDNLETGIIFFSGFANVINAIRKAPKLVIGRIHGKVVGGGVGLVAACDYAIAAKSASIRLSEFTLGIGPFVVAPAIERKMGKTAFSEMTIDTKWHDSQWVYEKGLYNRLCDNIETLDTAVDDLAAQISKLSPDAAKELKKIFWESTENWDRLLIERARISGELVLSDFTKNFLKDNKAKK